MYSLEDEEFDSILKMQRSRQCLDPGDTAPSAVGSPTEEKQVLATLQSLRGAKRYCKQGGALVRSQLPCI